MDTNISCVFTGKNYVQSRLMISQIVQFFLAPKLCANCYTCALHLINPDLNTDFDNNKLIMICITLVFKKNYN